MVGIKIITIKVVNNTYGYDQAVLMQFYCFNKIRENFMTPKL